MQPAANNENVEIHKLKAKCKKLEDLFSMQTWCCRELAMQVQDIARENRMLKTFVLHLLPPPPEEEALDLSLKEAK